MAQGGRPMLQRNTTKEAMKEIKPATTTPPPPSNPSRPASKQWTYTKFYALLLTVVWTFLIVGTCTWNRWSLSLPMPRNAIIGTQFIIWLVGLLGIGLATVHIRSMIRQRDRSEAALLENEQRFRTFFEMNPDPTAINRFEDGRFVQVNQAFLDTFGYTREELIGRNIFDLSLWADTHEHRRFIQQLRRHQHISLFEARLRLKNDTVNTFLVSGRILDLDGVAHVLTISKNIEDLKAAQRQLETSEKRYRTLFNNASEGIILLSLDGRILDANRMVCQTLGYDPQEIRSLRVKDVIASEMLSGVQVAREKLFQKGFVLFESRAKARDGTTIPVEISARQVDFENEQTILCLIRDISERKRAEAERASLEAQLLQAQKMESIGRLVGGIAHDMNNMLLPILGYAEMVLEVLPEDHPARTKVENILKAADSTRTLTRQLLAFARKQVLSMETVRLGALISDFSKMLRRTIREDIRIEVILRSTSDVIRADRSQIEQILMNLAVNAQDAMPNGGKLTFEVDSVYVDEAYVAQHLGASPGPHVVLSVSDTGTGMDRETLERIFEPFFTTKERGQGTGLGLSTVYGIVKQHNGYITAYSEPGQGSVFKILFPQAQDIPDEDQPDTEKGSVRGHGETILVVEDEDLVRVLVEEILTHTGYNVVLAANGEEALSIVADMNQRIELLLTDIIMPGMNGRDLYLKLRERFPELKVLYMSGYSDNIVCREENEDENASFIQKPFTMQKLSEKIHQILHGSAEGC